MSDFNPNAPSPLGQELRYYQARNIPFPTNMVDLGMRIRPGATTITNMHAYLPKVKGAPGIALEIVTSLAPTQTVSYYYPGSDTGDTTTNWQDQAAGALNFGDINSPFQTATYGTNSVALSRTQKASAYFRGNNAGALAGERILRVRLGATIMNRFTVGTAVSTNDPVVAATGQVVMGGNTYIGATRWIPKIDAFQRIENLADWYLSPNTNLPWTVTEVDNIISAANADTMGINVYGKLDAVGMRATALWLEVTHCLENRIGFLYQRGALRQGWDRYTLGSTSAAAGNTEYYALIGTLTGSWVDFFSIAAMNATVTSDIPSTGPTDATHDHRQGQGIALTGPGGIARDSTTQSIGTDNESIGMLFEAAGPTILGESQPYVQLGTKDVYSGSTANVGQQITSPGTVPAAFAGVQFTVGWQDQTTVPDRPLTIQVRHGAAAISGGGTLDSTAILDPAFMPDGTYRDYFVPLISSFVPAINTQYTVLFSSPATNGSGYRFLRQDTRSDNLVAGTGTTLANVEGTTQGGQTDSYIEAGAQLTRYDLGVMLIAAPVAPVFTATVVPESGAIAGVCGATRPPYVRLTWTATALGASFGAYNIYRRRSAVPVQPWTKIGSITVPTLGPTATQVEANWREYDDFEATWNLTNTSAADGWDYSMTVYNAATNLESIVGANVNTAYGVKPTVATNDWETCNAAPWLNWPLRTSVGPTSTTMAAPKTFPQVAGRDFNLVRVQGTIPGRSYALRWAFQDPDRGYSDEWPELRGPRAAARSGRQIAVLRIRGDRNFGVISEPRTSQQGVGTVADADLFVTSNESGLTGANMPPGLVLNGTTQYVSTPSTGIINPTTSPFSIVICAVFPTTVSVEYLTKGTVLSGQAYGFGHTASANQFQFSVNGASANANVLNTSATWFDGLPHVAVGTSSGTAQVLYQDGLPVQTAATTTGSVSNATAFVAGANNGGATFQSALAPLQAWAYYPRVLTAAEALSVSRYLLGHSLQTVPVGPSAFYDLRDQRCWDGADTQVYDLSGNGLTAASVASPVPRGNPWPLADLDVGR